MQQLPPSDLLLVKTRRYCVLILLVIVIGVVYYPIFRADALPWLLRGLSWGQVWHPGGWWSDRLAIMATGHPELFNLHNSIPSLIHGFVSVLLVCLATVWLPQVSRAFWLFSMFLIVVTCEIFIGWFSWQDMLALTVGGMAAYALASSLSSGSVAVLRPTLRIPTRLVMSTLVAGSSFIAIGSYWDGYYPGECARYDEQGYCEEYKRAGVPVYMSYEKLRNSVVVEAARPPDRIGRLYLYREFVFLNERNEGIHIINNSNPAQPVNLGFIRVPGNTEIAVRGNYLYADSYIDLITLDLNDPNNITLVDRQENLFPYNAFQNIPNNVSFSRVDTDPQRGVIVSYRLSDS